ncbi:MAG TPA: glycine oxidase ThiO [Stellaceae bacterium]|nr:glycine oxidase ThiO [Stellaceae bacterium]
MAAFNSNSSASPTSPSAGAKPTVAIIGGGIIGLAIGWRLASAGCAVDIYEKGRAGNGATHAAAGMLAACVEVEPSEEALLPLTRASQELWPEFARDLEAASGMSVGYRGEGTLVVAPNRDDAEQLRFTYDLYRRLGLPIEWLNAAEALRREPMLHPRLAAACYSPADHQVDNRLVAPALIEAFDRAGGRLHENTSVDSIDIDGHTARGLVVDGRRRDADIVVLAAGAWSRGIPGLPVEAKPPVRPVKGQLIALGMDAASPLIRHVVWAPKAYLVPRLDGRLVIGATTEERGFDTTITAGGMLALLDGAWRVLPGIEELPVIEQWVGFRPGSRDDAPILGPSPVDRLVLATGHHRNGILLTPVTADAVSDYILTGRISDTIAGFGLDRFKRKTRESAAS